MTTLTVLPTVTLPVAELFGPTWQGEGPYAGTRAHFVRLGLCNLSCEWCDTPYTWDRTRYDLTVEAPDTPVEHVDGWLRKQGAHLVVLTGGEPLIHHQRLPVLLEPSPGRVWHVETNGTIAPPGWWPSRVAHTSVSPKVNTRDPVHRRLKRGPLSAWADLCDEGAACFKFVCATPADVYAAAEVAASVRLDAGHVWIMPEGTTTDSLVAHHRTIAPVVEAHHFNTTTRLHTLLWGDERGR